MRILKLLLYVVLGLLAVWLIAAALISGDCKFEKSITIDAPPGKVWENTNTLRAMDKWSPWNERDPNMKKSWAGSTGQPGEQQCWEGNEDVGKGCLKVIKVDAATKRIDVEMKFLTPYESEAMEYVIAAPEGTGSKATWGFTSKIPFPFSPMKLFMDLENDIGPDYTLGLQKLKALSEKP